MNLLTNLQKRSVKVLSKCCKIDEMYAFKITIIVLVTAVMVTLYNIYDGDDIFIYPILAFIILVKLYDIEKKVDDHVKKQSDL